MTGFEIAGVVLAGPAVIQQLLNVAIDGYRVFQDANTAGRGIQQSLYELDITRVRFEDWIRALSKCNGNLAEVLGENSRRYQLVLETLALIAGVFAQVEQLEKKYGIARRESGEEEHTQTRGRLGIRAWLKQHIRRPSANGQSQKSHSSSPAPSSSAVPSESSALPSSQLSLPVNSETTITNLSLEGDLEFEAPGLAECILRLEKVASEYQQTLSTFRKYEWVFSSRGNVQLLIEDLKKYISSLEILTSVIFQRKSDIAGSSSFKEFQVPLKLPFARLSKFVGREQILAHMDDLFDPKLLANGHPEKSRRKMVALHGMGGMGKSHIALEYVYRHAEQYSTVIWVDVTDSSTTNASGRQTLETLIAHYATKYPSAPDFARIATDLGIPGQVDNAGQLINESAAKSPWETVRRWMAKDGNTGWCLIADGANHDRDTVRLRDVLPVCGHGHIIVTSRVVVPECDHHIDIPIMDKESGLKFLLGDLFEDASQDAREAAEKIAETLGYLPLALSQAVAYMKTRGLELADYLHRLCKDLSRLISNPIPPYTDGVFSCWKLSVDALMETNPDAIYLLRLCSFLSPEGVSKELLYRGLKGMGWLDTNEFRLDDAIDDLVRYALMKCKASATGGGGKRRSFWIHPLVQHWAKHSYSESKSVVLEKDPSRVAQLLKEGSRSTVCFVASSVVENDRGSDEWIFERENMAHFRLCYDDYIPRYITAPGNEDIVDERLALALRRFGRLRCAWSEEVWAEGLLLESVRLYYRLLPATADIEVALLQTKMTLAELYLCHEFGCSIENIGLLIDETVLGLRLLLGEFHPDALWSMTLKATHLAEIGWNDEGVELFQKCLENNEKALPPGHPYIFNTMSDLAMLHHLLGNADQALELSIRAFEQCEMSHGVNHPKALLLLRVVAEMHRRSGDFDKACECFQRVAKGLEATFGVANKTTLSVIGSLREAYCLTGRFEEALWETERYLEGWRVLRASRGKESGAKKQKNK
ncbi:hypothetical protein FN846DRAFT_980026 [Sphaerosporella brunnea]|uniref:NB-ARC domain-containing protein n=1 Tax=Sphaerosporella brunnea TaxID=1250544 RepID=A0A5J5ED83_9PEZI|nr:hypothetical protein FN846DRAFT_980026 [Sphaerosporella brunnea]